MLKLLNLKNMSLFVNFIAVIMLLIFSLFKKGSVGNMDGGISFISDKIASVEKMQIELLQKDTIIKKIRTENELIQTHLLRQYQTQTIILNKQNKDFVSLQEKLTKLGIDVNNLNTNISISINKIDSSVTKLNAVDHSPVSLLPEQYVFNDSTKHLKLTGSINLKDSIGLNYHYEYNAKYDIITYTKKVGFKRNLYGTIISDDPNGKINFQSIVIKTHKPTAHIGAGIGFSAAYHSKKIYFLPTISVSFYKPIFSLYL